MGKLLGLKSLIVLTVITTFVLTACGGGDPGNPVIPGPKLIMTPNISSIVMTVGQSAEPVKISGGQTPYYVGATGGVNPTLLSDGTLYLQAVTSTSSDCSGSSSSSSSSSDSSSSSSSNSTDAVVWIQDSSYNQTQIQFNVCVQPASTSSLLSSLGSSSPATITLSPGESQTFTVYGGVAPYTATSSNTSIASVSSGGASGIITVTAGQTTGTATVTIYDANGSSYGVQVTNTPAAPIFNVSPNTLNGGMGDVMSLSVGGGVGPYTVASSNPNVATASVSNSLVSVSMVGAGTATITVYDSTNASTTATVTVSGGFAVIPPTQLLAEGQSTPISFSVLNGPSTGPYFVSVPATVTGSSGETVQTSSLITVTPMSFMGGSAVQLQQLQVAFQPVPTTTANPTGTPCIKSNFSVPLTVTDTATGATATATVEIQNINSPNDGSSGCL